MFYRIKPIYFRKSMSKWWVIQHREWWWPFWKDLKVCAFEEQAKEVLQHEYRDKV